VHRKKAALELNDDMFGDVVSDSGDLFGSTQSQKVSNVTTSAPTQTTVSSRRKLNPTKRAARFDQLLEFVSCRTGLKPVAKTPEQVRNSAWGHLFDLATTREQLECVTELFPQWRDSRREFNEETVKKFIRRCDELKCPDLALDVFCDHSKYRFPLSSITAARLLMHSLHLKQPLASSVTLMALYPAYNLPPVSTDLVSCTMLATACLNQENEQSKVLADALVPSIKRLLESTPPTPRSKPVRYSEDREPAWLARTLAKIEGVLEEQGRDHKWLHEWRERNGHLVPAS